MDKKTIECSFCSGKGFVPCKTCGGNTTVKCPDCGGEGREYKICKTCYKGYVTDTRSLDDDKTLCPDCHGNYRDDLGPCKKCGGKGEIVCESCSGAGKTECEVCKGKGKISFWDYIEIVHFKDIDEFIESCKGFKVGYNMFHVHNVTPKVWKEMLNAAKNGNDDAAFALGMCYAKGIYHGNRQDLDYNKMAASWFKKSADAGNGYGQYVYALCRDDTQKRGDRDRIALLERAGEQNVVMALVFLAFFFDMSRCAEDYNGENKLRARERCKKIMAIKDSGGECDDIYYDFAKAHIDFLTKALDGESVEQDIQKWWHGNYKRISVRTSKEIRAAQAKFSKEWRKERLAAGFKSRRKFVLIGVFFGLLGLQFAYARRWKFFFAHWAALITTLFFPLAFIVCIALWFGSILFMKEDGGKDEMVLSKKGDVYVLERCCVLPRWSRQWAYG